MEFTRDELVAAFRLWAKEAREGRCLTSEETIKLSEEEWVERNTEALIHWLEEVKAQ